MSRKWSCVPACPTHSLDPQAAHEPLDRAAGNRHVLPMHLAPDLARAVDLEVSIPDTVDIDHALLVPFGPVAA